MGTQYNANAIEKNGRIFGIRRECLRRRTTILCLNTTV